MNEKLNIQNLIELLAEKHGMDKKDAEGFVKEFFQLIEERLESDKYVKIRGLGTFKLIDVENRESVNINTGERFEIQGYTKVSFTPEPSLKDVINKPFSHFETVVLNDETVLDDTPVDGNYEKEEEKEEVSAEQIVEADETVSDTLEEETVREVPLAQPDIEYIADVEPKEEMPAVPTYEVAKPDVPAADNADGSTMKFFIGIVVFVVLLCVGAVVFMYYPDLFDREPSPSSAETVVSEKTEMPTAPAAVTDSIIQKDTTLTAKEDTVAEVITSKPVVSAPVRETKKPVAAPFEPDSLSYKIVGTKTTYTIKEGETLTRVALRFYGTKALWPYIVKYNPDVIKNPDKVPYGTVIKIPELVKK